MKKFFTIVFGIILPVIGATAQTAVDSAALRALQVGRVLTQERVYMQFDNTAYYLGETMWFKAYATIGSNDAPSSLSRVLYVELVAPEGYVVETKKYKLDKNGCCNGEFELHPLLLSGYYEVRAYTRYMLNWGDEAVFSRVFPVFDKVNANNWDFKNILDRKRGFMKRGEWINAELPDASLTFYPEGGHLVDGIESKVAYELRGKDGEFGKEEIVISEDGKPIITTTPEHNGKGTFTLTPVKGRKYQARTAGFTFDLPKSEAEGVTLSVTQSSDSVSIRMRSNYNHPVELGFAILHRGSMGYYKKTSPAENSRTFTIAKTALPEGVCRAVVFATNVPLAERQFFVQHDSLCRGDRETVRLNVKANGYKPHNLRPAPHDKITLTVEREDGKPIDNAAEFAISVTDASGNQNTSWGYNMYTYLLLGSELKGYIPDAGQYFAPDNDKRTQQLDLLMLTHGWTSYDWNKLATGSLAGLVSPERGITLRGTLYEKRKNNRPGSIGTFILKPEKYNQTTFDISYDGEEIERSVFRTDSLGRFAIEADDFYGKRTAVLTPTRRYQHTDKIWYGYSLDRYFSPKFRLYDHWERTLGSTLESTDKAEDMLRTNPFEYMISSVEVVAAKKKTANSRPPHSEMRFDYLDEWEYAQDVTFLKSSSANDELADIAIEEYLTETIMDAEIENYSSENETDTDILENEESKNKGTNILDYLTPSGIITLGSNSQYTKYIGRIRYGGSLDNSLFIGALNLNYERALTAEDVVKSAMYRHNYNWAYWVQLMAVLGEYDSDSVPRPDTKYYKGKNVEKMVNFKEFVIRSDEKTRSQFQNTGIQWDRKSSALDSKLPYTKFYLGFLSQTYLIAKEGVDDAPMPELFLDAIKSGEIDRGTGRSHPEYPNYVACLIPYTAKDSTQEKIIPDFLGMNTVRYTSLQGYTESKQFYSPDYGNMQPQSDDHRRTLLWCPKAKVSDGKIVAELYNSAMCNAVNISVNGAHANIYYSNDEHMRTRTSGQQAKNTAAKPKKVTRKRPVLTRDSALLAQYAYDYETGEIYYNQGKYGKAIKIFAELTQYNYPPALRSVGICYLKGQGVKQKTDLALECFTLAAELGDIRSMYEAAMLYKNGDGVEQDDAEAFRWLQEASEAGEPRAQAALGDYYLNGTIADKDTAFARSLYRSSAMQKEPDGLFKYGIRMLAEGTPSDDTLGTPLECIKAAATKNHIEAMLHMMRHEDAAQNHKAAYEWARKLHLAKNKAGTLYMADCYEKGLGVQKDKSLADDLRREVGR